MWLRFSLLWSDEGLIGPWETISNAPQVVGKTGGADRDRTGGLFVANEALSDRKRQPFNELATLLVRSWSKKPSVGIRLETKTYPHFRATNRTTSENEEAL
jgi:hypothetical protein